MAIPGGPTDQFAERSLLDLQPSDFSPTLQPLYAFRDRLLAIEGLSHTSALADIAAVAKAGTRRPEQPPDRRRRRPDGEPRAAAHGDVLHRRSALARPGARRTRLGARAASIRASTGSTTFPTRSSRRSRTSARDEATPMVSDPSAAFSDLLGYVTPAAGADEPRRPAAVAAPVGARHGRPRVRSARAAARRRGPPEARAASRARPRARAEPRHASGRAAEVRHDVRQHARPASTSGPSVRQFMSLIRLAFACDLTRIVTFSAPVPQCPELGYPADATFHGYAHQSILGNTSCGQMFSPARRAGDDRSRRLARGSRRVSAAAARLRARRGRERSSTTPSSSGSPSSRRRRTSTTTCARCSPAGATASSTRAATCDTRGPCRIRCRTWRSRGRRTTGCT